jgi:hypothetical protein
VSGGTVAVRHGVSRTWVRDGLLESPSHRFIKKIVEHYIERKHIKVTDW